MLAEQTSEILFNPCIFLGDLWLQFSATISDIYLARLWHERPLRSVQPCVNFRFDG